MTTSTMTTPTEPWRTVLRNGLLPLLSDDAVFAIYFALANDRPDLMQGASTSPPPMLSCADQECQAGCLLSYGPWKALKLRTVGEVEEQFVRLCYDLDMLTGDRTATNTLLKYFDETPRDEMIRTLLPEFRDEVAKRENKAESRYDDCTVV